MDKKRLCYSRKVQSSSRVADLGWTCISEAVQLWVGALVLKVGYWDLNPARPELFFKYLVCIVACHAHFHY